MIGTLLLPIPNFHFLVVAPQMHFLQVLSSLPTMRTQERPRREKMPWDRGPSLGDVKHCHTGLGCPQAEKGCLGAALALWGGGRGDLKCGFKALTGD